MTKTEQKIYDAIKTFQSEHGFNPTRKQIELILKFRNREALRLHIKSMIEKDILTFPPGRPSKELIIKIKK